jgi:hypothetical protein
VSSNPHIDAEITRIKMQISSIVPLDVQELVSSLLTHTVALAYNQGHIDGTKNALNIISNADVSIRPVTRDYSHLQLVSED